MQRREVLSLFALTALAACSAGSSAPPVGPDGKPLPQVYRITPQVAQAIPFRLLDSVNSLRSAKGAPPLAYNAILNAAAETHSRDMSVQNRPWHFGSDGSSPLVRVQRVGYQGKLLGELISETYETELETLAVWMKSPDQKNVLMDPRATQIGFAWYQEPEGKIWWTLLTGE